MAEIDWPLFSQHVAAVVGPAGQLSTRQAARKWPATNPATWSRAANVKAISAGNYLAICRALDLDPYAFYIGRSGATLSLNSILNQNVTDNVSRETRRRAGRDRLPDRRASETAALQFSSMSIALSWSHFSDGRLGEIFLSSHKAATPFDRACREIGILLSLLLQHGIDPGEILHSLSEDEKGDFDGLAAAALRLIENSEAAA